MYKMYNENLRFWHVIFQNVAKVSWQLGFIKNSPGKAISKSGISLELLSKLVWNQSGIEEIWSGFKIGDTGN